MCWCFEHASWSRRRASKRKKVTEYQWIWIETCTFAVNFAPRSPRAQPMTSYPDTLRQALCQPTSVACRSAQFPRWLRCGRAASLGSWSLCVSFLWNFNLKSSQSSYSRLEGVCAVKIRKTLVRKAMTRRAWKILRFFRHFSTTRTYLDDNRERERGPIVSVGVDPQARLVATWPRFTFTIWLP